MSDGAGTRGQRPVLGRNFRVEIDEGNGRITEIGCSEVLFPPLHALPDLLEPGQSEHLVLRRATTGAPEWSAWWDKCQRGRAPQRRSVRVTLLADDHATEVMRWRFRNARAVSLHYSALQALADAMVIETITIAFDGVELG